MLADQLHANCRFNCRHPPYWVMAQRNTPRHRGRFGASLGYQAFIRTHERHSRADLVTQSKDRISRSHGLLDLSGENDSFAFVVPAKSNRPCLILARAAVGGLDALQNVSHGQLAFHLKAAGFERRLDDGYRVGTKVFSHHRRSTWVHLLAHGLSGGADRRCQTGHLLVIHLKGIHCGHLLGVWPKPSAQPARRRRRSPQSVPSGGPWSH
ncbi:hypothetical protein D3C84_776550 [compost metagenome]